MKHTISGALAVLLGLTACGGKPTAPIGPTPPDLAKPTQPTGPLDAAGLATQIDPGALPGGLGATPPSVAEVLHVVLPEPPPDLEGAMTNLVAQITGTNGSVDLSTVGPLLGLIAVTTRYEDTHHDACPLACLTQLAVAYRALDIPMLADSSNAMMQALEQALTRSAGAADAQRVIATLHWAFARAPYRQRQLTAEMLRTYPGEIETTDAVRQYARRTTDREEFDQGYVAWQYVATRPTALPDERLAAARACIATLSATCPPVAGAEDTAAQAATVQRLRSATTPEDRLALAAAYVELQHLKDAKAVLVALRATLPHDARPVAALADIALRQVLGNPEARELLDSAQGFDHKDQTFYELYLGTLFVDVLQVIGEVGENQDDEKVLAFLTTRLAPISDAVAAYATFQPARAAVLRVMVQGAITLGAAVAQPKGAAQDKHVQVALAQIFTQAIQVRAQFPNERDAHLLVILLSHFKPATWPVIDQALQFDVPAVVPDRQRVLAERANALFHEALASGKLDRLTLLQAWLAEIPPVIDGTPTLPDLRADASILAIGLKQMSWSEIASVYRALLPGAPDDESRSRYENNVAAALYRSGAKADAMAAWGRAAAAQATNEVLLLNRAAVAGPTAEAIATLTKLSTDGEAAGVRFQAAAWLRTFAIQKGDKKQPTIAALRAKLLTGTAAVQLDGMYGAVSHGAFSVGLGYSTRERLVTNLSVTMKVFLVVPAPGTSLGG